MLVLTGAPGSALLFTAFGGMVGREDTSEDVYTNNYVLPESFRENLIQRGVGKVFGENFSENFEKF